MTAFDSQAPVVHVGYPKSASSSLQGLLFGRHPQVNFLSHHVSADDATPFQADRRTKQFYEALYLTPGDAAAISAARELWCEHFRPQVDQPGRRAVYGCEDFCNSVRTDVLANPRRLRAVLGEVKIVMVVRDQHEIVRSMYEMLPYAPFLADGGGRTLSIERWLDLSLNAFDRSFLAGLDYAQVAAAYRAEFGEENLLVVPYESLSDGAGVRRICDFAGIDAEVGANLFQTSGRKNTAAQYRLYNLRRRLIPTKTFSSRFLPASVRKPLLKLAERAVQGKKTTFPDVYRTEFARLYGEGNRTLLSDEQTDHVGSYPGMEPASLTLDAEKSSIAIDADLRRAA